EVFMWLISRASAQLFWRAGPSTRMGRPKQLLQFCGQTMVRRAASVVVKARMPPCGRRDGRTRGGHERSFERTRRARSGEPAMAIRNKLFHPRRLRHCRGGSLLFRSSFSCSRQFCIDFSRIGWRDATIIVVRLRQIILAHQQRIETFATAKLEFLVHLDRLKWANLDANLAAHANGDINVEDFCVKLWFADVIGLLVFALY